MMMAGRRTLLLLILVIAGGVAAWALWRNGRERTQANLPANALAETPVAAKRPPPPPNDYVGDSACVECHASIGKEFDTHPMSHSLSLVTDDSTLETFGDQVEVRPGGRCIYRVRQLGDSGLAHDEVMLDLDGKPIFERTVIQHYSIGSGQQGRSYVTNSDGILTMSPVTWYSRGNRWDLSPGYVPDDPRGFSRRIVHECLACHAGQVVTQAGTTRYAADPFKQASIGCENCHGPGKRHVDFRMAAHRSGDDPIVNPAKLPPAERESVCNQCHLQAAARIPRYGRSFFDFRPGQRLDEVLTVFLAGEGAAQNGKTESVSHVQQMMASECFKQSRGALGCTSCHDPHRLPNESEHRDFYRQRCLKCHADVECGLPLEDRMEHESKNSCYECHMPRLEAIDVAHAAQTDHRIIKHAAAAGDHSPEVSDRLVFFDEADQRMPVWEANRAAGLAIIEQTAALGRLPAFEKVEQLLAGCLQIAPDDVRVSAALTQLAVKTGNWEAAERYARQTLEHEATNETALTAMVMLCYQTERIPEGLEFADKLLEIDPMNDILSARRADMLRLAGRMPEAIASAEHAIDLNPRLIPLRRWLCNAYRETGETAKSDEQMEIIRRMEELPTRNEANRQ